MNHINSIKKFSPQKNDIIVIDGLWGTGKSMLAPIISGMDRVEKYKSNYIYEYFCQLNYLNKIDYNASVEMLKYLSDIDQYDNLIGREVNLRMTDDSGFIKNPGSLKYIKRIFGGEGDAYIDQINNDNIALTLMTHMALLVSNPIFDAFEDRLRFIEVVRHPVYMFSHWCSFFDGFDRSRVATISFDVNGNKIPWFIDSQEWKNQYISSNSYGKAANAIIKLYSMLFKKLDSLGNDHVRKLLVISFEDIVFETEKSMINLSTFLGRSHSKSLNKILKNQKIPRKVSFQGNGHRFYGFDSKSEHTEEQRYDETLKKLKSNISPILMSEFFLIIKQYNKRFNSKLSDFM
jgi:hypothetical protein